jgi:N-methylhydantoinase B
LSDFTQGGGGYGDPLERDPGAVAHDVSAGFVSVRLAAQVFGVPVGGADDAGLDDASRDLRAKMRHARMGGQRADTWRGVDRPTVPWTTSLRFHESLELGRFGPDGTALVRCNRCQTVLGDAAVNYKTYAARREIDLESLAGRRLPDESGYIGTLLEYSCPRCGVLFAVDVYCPHVPGEEDLWDIQLRT